MFKLRGNYSKKLKLKLKQDGGKFLEEGRNLLKQEFKMKDILLTVKCMRRQNFVT